MGLDPAWEPREVKRRVGYLPDAVGFYGGLTGRQNLRYTAKLNGLRRDEAERAIDEVLEQVGLTSRANDPVEQYSRGMRQRLGIADALVKSPDLLILDEPTTSIDPLGVIEILDLLRRLVDDRGLSIMLSSHLLSQVQSVCDRIGIFNAGRLIGVGTVDQLAKQFGDGTAVIEVGLELPTAADVERAATTLRGIPSVDSVDAPTDGSGTWRIHVRPMSAEGRVRQDILVAAVESAPGPDGPPAGRPIARRDLPQRDRATDPEEDRRQAPRVCTARRRTEARMSATTVPDGVVVEESPKPRPELRVPHGGWRVIAAKELGDALLSVRFIVLLIVLGLAAIIPLYSAADQIRQNASSASGFPAIFLALFTLGSPDYTFLQVDSFVAIVAPLLGLAFAFDAINGERSEGTLPRLLAQPIYRDDVINGKFAAGLAVIGVVLLAVVGIVAGFGIFRLGITPAPEEILRLVAWILVTVVYVGLWLAFGLLLSVVFRRAATSALIGFGVWFLFTTFGPLILNFIATAVSPVTGSTVPEQIGQAAGAAVHQPAPARAALLGGDRGPPQPAEQPAGGPPRLARTGPAGPAADPDPPCLRPEHPPGLAAGGRVGRDDRRLLRSGVRGVHAPGSSRLGRAEGDSSRLMSLESINRGRKRRAVPTPQEAHMRRLEVWSAHPPPSHEPLMLSTGIRSSGSFAAPKRGRRQSLPTTTLMISSP